MRETDRRKDEFLGSLSHELRNPLAPLRNALDELRRSGGDPLTAGRAYAIMERQLFQLVRLTDAGAAKLREARPAWERAQERLRSRLPEEIWSSLMDVLPELTRLADTA